MKDETIIIPVSQPWKWSVDFYEQTARILAKKNRVICITYDNPRLLISYIKSRKLPHLFTIIHKRFVLFTPIDFIPLRRFPYVNRINYFLNSILVRIFIMIYWRKKIVDKLILWVFDPQFYYFLSCFSYKHFVLYDIVDYLKGIGLSDESKKNFVQLEEKLLLRANLVTVNSKTLYQLYKIKRRNIYVVPQGFRLNLFHNDAYKKKSNFSKKPVIGYIGGLNNRLDYSLLFSLIQNNFAYQFIFAGQIQNRDADAHLQKNILHLFSYQNCTYVGNIPKTRIAAFLGQCGICIIPYDHRKSFNKYCYPMKLFEYFYMGKPVISTPIEELKRFPKFVHMGSTAKEWEKYVHILSSKKWPIAYRHEQRRIAIANSWERKIEKIINIIKSVDVKTQ